MSPWRQTVIAFFAVAGDRLVAHAGKQRFKHFRIRMGELDKFEAVGAGRVVFRDFCARCVVGERTHPVSPRFVARIMQCGSAG
jgi:hypothetical protein